MTLEQVIWTDADGGAVNLNDWGAYACTRERTGMWAPPYILTTTRMPLADGAVLNGVAVEARGIDLAQKVRGRTRAALIALMRDLSHRMDPTRGDGSLTIINETGSRILYCIPEGIRDGKDHYTSMEMTLSFLATDPYWYELAPTSKIIQNSGPVTTFFSDHFLPIRLIRSMIYAIETVTNPGDVDTYPIWTINGPGKNLVLTNLTTRKKISLGNLALTDGQKLVIDTRTLKKTIKLDGVDIFELISKTSSLWPLAVGDNSIEIQLSETDTGSSVEIDFTARYGSA